MRNWSKTICWPKITQTRLYYMLYLKNRNQEKFDQIRQQKGEQILPIEMIDPFTKFYRPPKLERRESQLKNSNVTSSYADSRLKFAE